MKYVHCDKCGLMLSNSFWNNPKSCTHSITIGFNQEVTHELTLCLDCFKKLESELYVLIGFYFELEKKSVIEG